MKTKNILRAAIMLSAVALLSQCKPKVQKVEKETSISLSNITVSPANIAQSGSEIKNISDGKNAADSTIFHTLWGGITKQDITIEADLSGKGYRLDKIVVSPRANGYNGIIKHADLWIKSNGKYKKVYTIDAGASNSAINIELKKSIYYPEKIKMVIYDTYCPENTYMVSLGEIECIMLPENSVTREKLVKDSKIFSDLTGTSLKSGIEMSDINKMKVGVLKDYATKLLNKTYSPKNMISEYEPYLDPVVLGQKMRIGDGFSKYEGITGVVLDKGEHIIFVGKTNGNKIKLLVPDWNRRPAKGINPMKDPNGWGLKKVEFLLHEGVNYVNLKKGGNVYIQYFTKDNPENHKPIKVHFPTGKYNGYFDITKGDTNEKFDKLLENAVSPVMDIRGKYTQVAFPVDSLKVFTKGRGVELISNFDTIVALKRHFIGWEKEGNSPKNRILARINYNYYMFRDGDGVAYIDWAMKLVADPKSVVKGDPCWGFSHEAGHVLQMRPQMTWGGMTEVSNNITTLYSTTSLGNRSRLSKQGVYAKARKTILDKGISYMDFPGKLGKGANQYGGNGNTDVFQRLVPFWQLHLYFAEQGYPDFYPDLMIAMRKQEPLGGSDKNKNYLNMLEFCRLACVVSKTDLTEFFQRWGFFYVGEVDVVDYGKYIYNITKEDVDKVKKAIASYKFPKPVKDITKYED